MQDAGRKHWGALSNLLQEISKSGENIVIDKDGNISSENRLKGGCLVSYVDCQSKKTEVVTLNEGDTFAYGDWDGKTCVRKTYTC